MKHRWMYGRTKKPIILPQLEAWFPRDTVVGDGTCNVSGLLKFFRRGLYSMCFVGLVFRFGRFGDVVTVDCGFATAFGKRSTAYRADAVMLESICCRYSE